MKTINEQLQDSVRWKGAQKILHDFEEMMKLIKEYPIKPIEQPVHSPHYTISE